MCQRRTPYLSMACLALFLTSCGDSEPTGAMEAYKLSASDGQLDDGFGSDVAIDGDTALVGAPEHDANGVNSGAVYVFVRGGGGWTEQAKLTPSDAAALDYFGHHVSLSGDCAVVGNVYDDDKGSDAGAVYIFVRNGTSWSQQAKLTASDGAAGDGFGGAVSLDGDTLVASAYGDDDKGSSAGAAYVFTRSGSLWSEQVKLTASDGAAEDWFGLPVCLDGDTVVIGAYCDDDNGSSSGSAYVFAGAGASWSEEAKLKPADGTHSEMFGYAASVSGDTAVLGKAQGNETSVYVFERTGSSWQEKPELVASDSPTNSRFGCSVSVCGTRAVVGADFFNSVPGVAYVFALDTAVQTEVFRLTCPDGGAGADSFGSCTALSDDVVAVGSSWTGSVYLFEWTPSADDSAGCNPGSAGSVYGVLAPLGLLALALHFRRCRSVRSRGLRGR